MAAAPLYLSIPFLPPSVLLCGIRKRRVLLPVTERTVREAYAKHTAYGKIVYVGAYRLLYGVYGNNSPAGFCIKARVIVFSEFAEI